MSLTTGNRLFRRILVPHDFSDHATRALEIAVGLVESEGVITVVHAVAPVYSSMAGPGADIAWTPTPDMVSEVKVPKAPLETEMGSIKVLRYPELAKKIEEEWKQQGGHRDASDKKLDQCILHSDNRTPFRELVAVLDAISAPRRSVVLDDGRTAEMPAFSATFSSR